MKLKQKPVSARIMTKELRKSTVSVLGERHAC